MLFLALTTLAALCVHPYFSWQFNFFHVWSRVGVAGLVMFIAYTVTGNVGLRRWKREHVQIVALVVAAFLGTVLAGLMMGRSLREMFTEEAKFLGILVVTVSGIVIGVAAASMSNLRERETRAYAELVESESKRHQLEKAMLAAHLQLLKAQIEPHFLFNTLANVQHLVETDSKSASRVIASLIRYLRAALPEMRADMTTVAKEVDMARAYLEISKVRMGDRLSYAIDLPRDLENFAFPPMMLMTLVENALKHGVDPCCDSGQIAISARRSGDQVEIVVADSGPGIAGSGATAGVGLKNIRERLQAMYGGAAGLTLAEPEGGGVVATLHFKSALQTQGGT